MYSDCCYFLRSIEVFSAEDDTVSNIKQEFAAMLPYKVCVEHGNQPYDLGEHSSEDYSNETEFGQNLIDLLLKKGEIEQTSKQQSQDVLKVRRDEGIKNERYDELITAFNVILGEILRQGKLSPPNDKYFTMGKNGPNYNQIDDDSQGMQHYSTRPRRKHTHSSTMSLNCNRKDAVRRCMNPIEGELFQKIEVLNNHLNALIRNPGNKMLKSKRAHEINSDSLNDEFSYAQRSHPSPNVSHSEQKSINMPLNDYDKREKPENITSSAERNQTLNVTQSCVSEILMDEQRVTNGYDSPVTARFMTVSSIGKRHTHSSSIENLDRNYPTDEEQERVLIKANNYGVDKPLFVKYGPNEYHSKSPTDGDRESVRAPTFLSKVGMSIPLRLIKGSNGRFNLVLDRRNICQNRRCRPRNTTH